MYVKIMTESASSIKLDAKDRKILLELDTDATQSLSKIARKLRTSKEAVSYRIRQLEEKGIIQNYIAIYNPAKFGLTYYKLYLKFSHITEEKRKEVIDFVKKEKSFSWLASLEGSFDLMIGIHFPSVMDFDNYKDSLFSRFGSVFQSDAFAILTEGEAYPRQYIFGINNPMRKVFVFCNSTKKEALDNEDMKIIKAVSSNSRSRSTEIAELTGLTPRIVKYRKNILEKKGVIAGYKLFINYRKLKYILFKCLVKLQNTDKKRFHDLLLYARRHQNVIYWQKVLGEWDVELDIEVSSIEEFYEIANDIRYKFSDIVQKFDTLIVTEDMAVSHF